MLIVLGAFLINLRFSSVMVLAPLPRLALMDQKVTPALVSFDSLSGITLDLESFDVGNCQRSESRRSR
jgi:hypothetical protein